MKKTRKRFYSKAMKKSFWNGFWKGRSYKPKKKNSFNSKKNAVRRARIALSYKGDFQNNRFFNNETGKWKNYKKK